jgi:MFS family permease
MVRPSAETFLYAFAVLFGFGMGADYMLIPLMAAEQFGVNSLARAMAVILPVNTIGQTWFPYFVSLLRDKAGNYAVAMGAVLAVALIGALAVAILPRRSQQSVNEPARIRAASATPIPRA